MALEWNKNLALRFITALSLLPVVLLPVWYGGWAFFILIAVGLALVQMEWRSLTGTKAWWPAALCTVAATLLMYYFWRHDPQQTLWRDTIAGSFSLVIISFFCVNRLPTALWPIVGFAYALMTGLAILWLRALTSGEILIIWLLFAVWGMDVGGYFAGKAIGGPKLAPTISPNKTWAGLMGGVALSMLISIPIVLIFDWRAEGWPMWLASMAAGAIAFVAQIGDLYESKLKRVFGIKDSGGLIPGHGGVLDRVDGLVFGVTAVGLFMLALFTLR